MGLPRWLSSKEPTCQCKETQEIWVQSLGRKDPLEEEMATTPVSLPGECHGQRNLGAMAHRVVKSQTRLSIHAPRNSKTTAVGKHANSSPEQRVLDLLSIKTLRCLHSPLRIRLKLFTVVYKAQLAFPSSLSDVISSLPYPRIFTSKLWETVEDRGERTEDSAAHGVTESNTA